MPFYSLGSDATSIENQLTAELTMHFDPVFVARPAMELPFIPSDAFGKVFPGIWGIPNPKGLMDIWYPSEGIIKNRITRLGIRKRRCLIPANGFFIRFKRKYYFIYFPDEPVITLAGIYQHCKDPDRTSENYNFTLLLKSPVSRLGEMTTRAPVIITAGSRRKYLNSQRPLMDITHLLQREIRMNLKGIEILPEVLIKKNPEKADFLIKQNKLFPAQKFPEKEILGSYYYF